MYDSDELRALAESSLGGTLTTAREKLYQAMTPVVVLDLLDEIERLRKDAERYRWLRDLSEPGICSFYLSVGKAFDGVKFKRKTVDEAIDAARTQGGDA